MTRILAAIVVPPHLAVSGGARAAEHLSAALAGHCDVAVASMMNGAAAGTAAFGDGAARARRLAVRSWLPPLAPWSRLPNRYSTLFYRSDLPAIAGRGGYDLVHLHNPMPALEFERTARACAARRVPYVVSTHGFNEVANGARIYGFGPGRALLWRRLVVSPVMRAVRGAAAVLALSEADVGIVRGMGFAGDIDIVPNGVPEPARGDAAGDRALLGRLGIPAERQPGQIACMFLANHTPNKGLPDLLAAFARLRRPYLLVVGGERRDGVDYDGAVRACGPGQRIVVTGRMTDAEVAAVFRRSDLFVFPTLADTFPLAVLEAMAHGLPVLATRVGGIPHQVDARCGVLVPPGDPAALAGAVEALAREPSRLAAIGRAARSRALAEFGWPRAAELAAATYRRVLGARTSPGAAAAARAEAEFADAG